MTDLSEASASLNVERMGDVVRKNTRQNNAPRFMPTSARASGVEDDTNDTPHVSVTVPEKKEPAPITDEVRIQLITNMLGRLGSMHHLLTPEEREQILLSTIDPNAPVSRMFHTRPGPCVFGGGLVAIVLGILVGLVIASATTPSHTRAPLSFRSISTQPSSTSQRVVDRMLNYA